MEAGLSGDEQIEDDSLQFERISTNKRIGQKTTTSDRQNFNHESSQDSSVYQKVVQPSHLNFPRQLINHNAAETNHLLERGTDEDFEEEDMQSHIVAEAGEDVEISDSLQHILLEE